MCIYKFCLLSHNQAPFWWLRELRDDGLVRRRKKREEPFFFSWLVLTGTRSTCNPKRRSMKDSSIIYIRVYNERDKKTNWGVNLTGNLKESKGYYYFFPSQRWKVFLFLFLFLFFFLFLLWLCSVVCCGMLKPFPLAAKLRTPCLVIIRIRTHNHVHTKSIITLCIT